MKIHHRAQALFIAAASICGFSQKSFAQYYPQSFGINAPTNPNKPMPIANTIQRLKDLKMKTVRLWLSINDWADPTKAFSADSISAIRKYKAAKFDVLVVLSPEKGAVPANDGQVTAAMDYLMSLSGMTSVDRWEIGNEVDSKGYWNDTSSAKIANYVNKFLKPAAIVLHSHGQKVVSAGPSWNPDDVQRMVDAGMLNYADVVGFHMYTSSVNNIEPYFKRLVKSVGTKPLAITEWTVRGHQVSDGNGGYKAGDSAAWAKDNAAAYPIIARYAKYAYFFATYANNQMAGCFSILKSDSVGSPNEPSFSAYMDRLELFTANNVPPDQGVATPTPPSDPTPVPTPVVAPAINSVSLVDGDLNQIIHGYEALSAKTTLDIEQVRVANYNFSANVNAQTLSTRLTWDGSARVESHAPFTAFADDASGNFGGQAPVLGTHTLTIVPFSGVNATGNAGAAVTIQVTVIDSHIPTVASFSVFDADKQTVIPGFENINGSATLSLATTGVTHYAVTAQLNGASQSVSLSSSNGITHTENHAPFAFYYDDNPTLRGIVPVVGIVNYSAFSFSLPDGAGEVGQTATFTLTIVK